MAGAGAVVWKSNCGGGADNFLMDRLVGSGDANYSKRQPPRSTPEPSETNRWKIVYLKTDIMKLMLFTYELVLVLHVLKVDDEWRSNGIAYIVVIRIVRHTQIMQNTQFCWQLAFPKRQVL